MMGGVNHHSASSSTLDSSAHSAALKRQGSGHSYANSMDQNATMSVAASPGLQVRPPPAPS
jgi:hypothetical protein